MPFALGANPTTSELSDAINYLLNNFGSNVSIDLTTGVIAGPSGRISNLYKYIQIKYATNYNGSVGFSNSPTNATYYGVRNSNDPTESTNPNEYIWFKTTGFGTTNYLWYIVAGGRQIDFYISPTAPSDYYLKDPGTSIDIDIITATKTVNAASPAIFIWTSGSAPTRPSTTSTYTWATGAYSAPSGWSTTPTSNSTPGYVQWIIQIPLTANSNVTSSTLDWTNTAYAISQFSANGVSGASGASGASGSSGSSGSSGFSGFSGLANQNAIAYLYQWANSAPGNPNGSSTFTWATGINSAYTGTNGWYTYVPTNPGTPNTYLWQASKSVTDVSTATTTTVNWVAPFGFSSIAQNGANGATGPTGNKFATASVYQWALSTPSISGSSTYTWSTTAFTPNPTGWSNTITAAPSGGYYLYTATVSFSDVSTATTTSINWTTSSIVVSGYSSLNGESSRICYTRIPGLPSPTSGFVTTTGSSTFPTSTQSNTTWGLNYTWYASDPNPSSTDSLYQSDGIYSPSTGNTVWATPYLSSLRVGELSAIAVNAGQITVSSPSTGLGYIKAGTALLSGSTMSGYGGIIKQDGTFAFGNSSTGNLVYDGSNFNINGSANLNVNGSSIFSGSSPTSELVYVAGSYYTINSTTVSYGTTTGSNQVRVGSLGTASATGYTYNVGALGIGGQSNGYGVVGEGSAYGGYFSNTLGGSGLYSYGVMGTNSTVMVNNLYSQYTQNLVNAAATHQLRLVDGTLTGSGVATFVSANKPGGTTSNTWIQVQLDATTLYIPVWT
jgi:collagen type VII alpha